MFITPFFIRSPLLTKKSLRDMNIHEALARDLIKKSREKDGQPLRRLHAVQNLHEDFNSATIFSTTSVYIKYGRYIQNTKYKFDTFFQVINKAPLLCSFYNNPGSWKLGDEYAFATDLCPFIYSLNTPIVYERLKDWWSSMSGKMARIDILINRVEFDNYKQSNAVAMVNIIEQEKARRKRLGERLGLA